MTPPGPWERLGRHLRFGAVAYAVLIISLLLTLLAYFYARQSLEAQTGDRFQEAVSTSERVLDRRTDAYVDALIGGRAYFLASRQVEREEWERYITELDLRDRYEGFQALGYVDHLGSQQEFEGYEDAIRDEGLPPLHPDLSPGGERESYDPVEFIGPLDEANRSLISYDYHVLEEHRAAMERARDSGEPQATSRVYVLTEADPGASAELTLQPGFFVYIPVYEKGQPLQTTDERRRAIEGYVFGSFRMDRLLTDLLPGRAASELDFEVYDGGRLDSANLLYDQDGVLRAEDASYSPRYSASSKLEVAGRDWSLYFATLPGFAGETGERLTDLVLISGILVSVVLFIATWLLAASRERAERASRDLEEANRGLEVANQELEAFSYSVSHDLRAPLRSIEGFSQVLVEDYSEALDREGVGYLGRVQAASRRMSDLIDDLLQLSRVTRAPIQRSDVDLSAMAREISAALHREDPDREVEWVIKDGLRACGDARLLRVVLDNLLGNAWKFTSRNESARIEVGETSRRGVPTYYVRDDGAGFEMSYAEKLFGAFQRLHTEDEFEGTGIGLATVARIVRRHGGEAWAEGEVGKGAIFFFTLEGARQKSRKA